MVKNVIALFAVVTIFLWAILVCKSYLQLRFSEASDNRQFRLRQKESIVEISSYGSGWVNKKFVPSNVVFVDNLASSVSDVEKNEVWMKKSDQDGVPGDIRDQGENVSEDQGVNEDQREGMSEDQREGVDNDQGVNENQREGVDDDQGVNENQREVDDGQDINEDQREGVDEDQGMNENQREVDDGQDINEDQREVDEDQDINEDQRGVDDQSVNDQHENQKIPPIHTTVKLQRSPSTNTNEFYRHPINTKDRTAYNDVLININIKTGKVPPSIDQFSQLYSLYYNENGSFTQESTPRTQPFLPNTTQPDFTIISQTTQERLFFIPYLLERWQGSYSIAIFCSPEEQSTVQEVIRSSQLPSRMRVLLYVHTSTDDCVNKIRNKKLVCVQQEVYPINRLRNLAISNVLTTHFILFDMDMWPAKSTYQTLLNLPDAYLQNPFFVTIIPAFSLTNTMLKHHPCTGFKECVLRAIPLFPETKKDLALCAKRHKCSIFRPMSKTHNYLTEDWYALDSSSQVNYLKCFQQQFMEPYVMVRRTESLPLLSELFINYGFNKVQWIENLRYLGYEFYVLSQAFAVDVPHDLSSFAVNYTKSFSDDSPEMLGLYRRYLTKMRRKFSDESRQLLCLSKRIKLQKYRK